jgi:hypothetical protein
MDSGHPGTMSLMPYYLWRTQRWGGLRKCALLLAIWLGTDAFALGFAWLLAPPLD